MKVKASPARGRQAKSKTESRSKSSGAPRETKAGATRKSVADTLAWLERTGRKTVRDGMARYAIPSDKAYGVSVGVLRSYAKKLGTDQALASELWKTDRYEARMLTAFLADPERLSAAQMDAWCRDFDNWAICDTLCFHLFDRTAHAWKKVAAWCPRREEFIRRAGFALLASLTVHDKNAPDTHFVRGLALIQKAASDERNFVKKAVNWALRSIGKRNRALNSRAIEVSKRLAASPDAAARWVGKDALRELEKPAIQRRLERAGAWRGER
jgi:3-methyladenine DNA glycosylase AlkD